MTTPHLPWTWLTPTPELPEPDELALRPIVERIATTTEQQAFVDHIRAVRAAASRSCHRLLAAVALGAFIIFVTLVFLLSTAGEVLH